MNLLTYLTLSLQMTSMSRHKNVFPYTNDEYVSSCLQLLNVASRIGIKCYRSERDNHLSTNFGLHGADIPWLSIYLFNQLLSNNYCRICCLLFKPLLNFYSIFLELLVCTKFNSIYLIYLWTINLFGVSHGAHMLHAWDSISVSDCRCVIKFKYYYYYTFKSL